MKKTILSVLIACLLLTGCSPTEFIVFNDDFALTTPVPEQIDPVEAERIDSYTEKAQLFLPSVSGQAFIPFDVKIEVTADVIYEQALAEALIAFEVPDNGMQLFPEGTKLLSCVKSGDTVIINLSKEVLEASAQQLFMIRSAFAKTLCGCDVDFVDVLAENRALPLTDLPTGAMTLPESSPSAGWAHLSAEELIHSPTRIVTLYRIARDSGLLIPQTKEITFEDDLVTPVLEALMREESTYTAFLAGIALKLTGYELSEDGSSLRLNFDGNFSSVLERSGISMSGLCAALTCTLCGFMPKLEGIKLYIGDGQVAHIEDLAPEDGIFTPAMFTDDIGTFVNIYMTAPDGKLARLYRALPAAQTASVRSTLKLLFDEPKEYETGVVRLIPEELTESDLLGIRISKGEAVVDLSEAFYAGCQRLTETQERNLVYAFVNMLTDRPDVTCVRFLINGEHADRLAAGISIASPLMRNPGLIE